MLSLAVLYISDYAKQIIIELKKVLIFRFFKIFNINLISIKSINMRK